VIADGLAFIGDAAGGPGSAAHLLETMDRLHIDHAVIGGIKRHEGESPNAQVADAVRRYPGRLTGLIRVNPWARDWRAELDRYAGDGGLAGVLLQPWEDGFRMLGSVPREIVAAAAERGLPVTVAAGYPWVSEAPQIAELAGQFPGTTFMLSNEGQLNISGLGATDVVLLLSQCPNVVVHSTGAYREDFFISLAEKFGPGRLMYASGYPRFSPEYELRRVQWTETISDAAKEQILGVTLSRIFRLPAA
jgi:predicted TIM-barrel fold metal-dependent hydrolase